MLPENLYTPDGHHVTKLQALCQVTLERVYDDVKFGQVYWVDFGEGYGAEIPYQRPAVVVQDNFFNHQTVLVVPLSSKATAIYNQIINPTINFKDSNLIVGDISEEGNFTLRTDSSTLLFEHIQTVDLSRLRNYLFTIQPSKLRELLKKATSCIFGFGMSDPNEKKPPLTIQNTATIIKAADKKIAEEQAAKKAAEEKLREQRKHEPLPFDTKHFSDKQKKIYNFITRKAYSELKYSSDSYYESVKDFIQTCFGFSCTPETLDLIIDCLQSASNAKDNNFDLCNYARNKQSTSSLKYEQIIQQISDPIKAKFLTIKGFKVSEFISFIAMIINTAKS